MSLRAVRLIPRSRSLTDRGLSLAASANSSWVSRASIRSCRSSPAKESADWSATAIASLANPQSEDLVLTVRSSGRPAPSAASRSGGTGARVALNQACEDHVEGQRPSLAAPNRGGFLWALQWAVTYGDLSSHKPEWR